MKKISLIFYVPLMWSGLFASETALVGPEGYFNMKGHVKSKWEYTPREDEEHTFKTEVALNPHYEMYDIWCEGNIKASTTIGSITKENRIEVEKAYIAYHLTDTTSLLLGRMPNSDLFYSNMQFGSKFNGAAAKKVSIEIPHIKSTNVTAGTFVVGKNKTPFGGIAEVQASFIDFPIDVGYSFIYWGTQPHSQVKIAEYGISQVSATSNAENYFYNQDVSWFFQYARNHLEQNSNEAWTVGVGLGKTSPFAEGQWGLIVSFVNVKELSIPQHDLDCMFKGIASRGLHLQAVYALSANLKIKGKFSHFDHNKELSKRDLMELSATCTF